MSERTEALRRFPPAEAQKLIPMTIQPEPVEELRRELRKLPTWKLHQAYDKLTRREKTSIEVIEKHRSAGTSIVVDGVVTGGIFLILKLIAEVLRETGKVPQTVHQYATVVRTFMDEMERLHRSSDQNEYYRRKKLVRQAIKERERGQSRAYPDISLTDLRQILKELDMLYD